MADNKIDELRDDAFEEARMFKDVFGSPEGQKVLKILEDEFLFSPIVLPSGDSRGDTARAAQVDVITFIHLNIKIGKGEQNAD